MTGSTDMSMGTGDWHRAVHVWLYVMATKQVLIQKRNEWKDSFPGLWDISAAGHGAHFC